MANPYGDISRRELLARGIAIGGVAMVGPSTNLFGQEALSKGAVPTSDAMPLDDLRSRIRGELVTSADASYDKQRQLWNGMIDRRPSAIVGCAGAADVINTVRFARANDLAISVRGGGHNVAGKALRDGALAIDLSPMKGLRVDPKARTGRAQAGYTWVSSTARRLLSGLPLLVARFPPQAVGWCSVGGSAGSCESTVLPVTICCP